MYGGFSGAELDADLFDLGEGVVLRKTYAHLMAPYLMAFTHPEPGKHHPAPWKAAKGGFGYDIEIELKVPNTFILGDSIEPRETIWWIASLLRMAEVPFLTVPVLSDQPFHTAKKTDVEPTIEPFEIEPRIMAVADGSQKLISSNSLEWVKEKWLAAGKLLNSNPSFYSALKAFDGATVRGKTSSSLLSLWGGLEQLFSPSTGEHRYRVSSLLASFLESPGESRLNLYKRILKLYNERSVAAHTANEIETGPLVETYILMRNILVRMIDDLSIPSQDHLERRLFGCL